MALQSCSPLQEHARDSFENLLFSLCRFYELTGHYPGELTVVGYDFKHERFTDLHRAALRWPDQHFKFVGTPALTAGAQEVNHTCLSACLSAPQIEKLTPNYRYRVFVNACECLYMP